jgi:hypothetical protein
MTTNSLLQEKANRLESTINQKQISQTDKQILLKELESLKRVLNEKKPKKIFTL